MVFLWETLLEVSPDSVGGFSDLKIENWRPISVFCNITHILLTIPEKHGLHFKILEKSFSLFHKTALYFVPNNYVTSPKIPLDAMHIIMLNIEKAEGRFPDKINILKKTEAVEFMKLQKPTMHLKVIQMLFLSRPRLLVIAE